MPTVPADVEAEVPRKSEAEIEQLVRDTQRNLVWVGVGEGRDLDPFEAVLRLSVARMSQGYIKSIALVYEYLDEAVEIEPDGMPLFRSAQFLNRADIPIYVEKLREARGGLPQG